MSLQKGNFILLDYVAKVKETGEVFDTTLEETAKKEHMYKEGDIYEPKLVVIGEGWVIKPLDENLTTMEVDKATVVEIPPDKAFGPRDPEKVKRVPLKQLLAKDITPTLGMRIEYGGKTATIRAIGAGRVLLDFNPPTRRKDTHLRHDHQEETRNTRRQNRCTHSPSNTRSRTSQVPIHS